MIVRPPSKLFAPLSSRVPEPVLVSAPVSAIMPAYVVVTPLSTLIVPPLDPKLIPRFELSVKLEVVLREPPLRTN